ncbi:hypothetical protein PsAD2_01651 [Pseudovibrio axinellae]|uniref:Muconolactone isomerase domain-containing protein n=1 Tax=Pseudovibrio axinellae TaxID=989403 RepID=A0A161V4W8_9HYPH|nr:hypothetical protein [Pseudovibrio axinellae]KZL19830.1 hypothetical protein PsAD2_01651 [Pseudovibrio axinellae]SER39807.1 Muconolactone delta-isomerase [Pseudovibrio axinellae]
MQILAVSKVAQGATMEKVSEHGPHEVKHTMEAYLDGKIRNFWFQVNRPGVVFILECENEDEARSILNEQPFVDVGLMEFDVFPLQPLLPFGTLIGRKLAF